MTSSSWGKVSNDGKDFVRILLTKSGNHRPSASQALQHKWLGLAASGTAEGIFDNLDISGLRSFSQMNQMKKAAVTVIATQLSGSKIKEMQKVFMAMDNNSDGTLSIHEFKGGLRDAGITIPKDLEELLEELD